MGIASHNARLVPGADTGVGYQSDIDLVISSGSVVMQCVECDECPYKGKGTP